MSLKKQIYSVLKDYWGYEEFREKQLDVIINILKKENCLVLLPTGSGKSICYQIPAILDDNLNIVISPLISLMQDQVDSLIKRGINASYLNSSLSKKKYKEILQKILNKKEKILYISPEQLISKKLRGILEKVHISRIIIDEAHCLTEWGYDFRPQYYNLIKNLKTFAYKTQIVAFTATATKETQKEIKSILNIENFKVIIGSFDRKNIFLGVKRFYLPITKWFFLRKKVNEHKKIIIFCSTRKETENLSNKLSKVKNNVNYYHAGLPQIKRKEILENYQNGKIKYLFSTSAFGMGIDISDIELSIYWNSPSSIEDYYQGIGRAGRDESLKAISWLLISNNDLEYQKKIILNKKIPNNKLKNIIFDLNKMLGEFEIKNKYNISDSVFNSIKLIYKKDSLENYNKIKAQIKLLQKNKLNKLKELNKYINTRKCKRKFILNYFSEKYKLEKCFNCSTCNKNKLKNKNL